MGRATHRGGGGPEPFSPWSGPPLRLDALSPGRRHGQRRRRGRPARRGAVFILRARRLRDDAVVPASLFLDLPLVRMRQPGRTNHGERQGSIGLRPNVEAAGVPPTRSGTRTERAKGPGERPAAPTDLSCTQAGRCPLPPIPRRRALRGSGCLVGGRRGERGEEARENDGLSGQRRELKERFRWDREALRSRRQRRERTRDPDPSQLVRAQLDPGGFGNGAPWAVAPGNGPSPLGRGPHDREEVQQRLPSPHTSRASPSPQHHGSDPSRSAPRELFAKVLGQFPVRLPCSGSARGSSRQRPHRSIARPAYVPATYISLELSQ